MEKLKNFMVDQNMTYVLGGNKSGDETNPTNHDFEIYRATDNKLVGSLHFQQGMLEEEGVNGVLNEDLLLILIDRIESFQRSKLACRENENALGKLYEALMWLNKRNNRRRKI